MRMGANRLVSPYRLPLRCGLRWVALMDDRQPQYVATKESVTVEDYVSTLTADFIMHGVGTALTTMC